MSIPETDRTTLHFAGWMGHEFVVVADSRDGGRNVSLKTSSLNNALSEARIEARRNPTVYRKVGGKWRKVA